MNTVDFIRLRNGSITPIHPNRSIIDLFVYDWQHLDRFRYNGMWYIANTEGQMRGPYKTQTDAIMGDLNGHQIDKNTIGHKEFMG